MREFTTELRETVTDPRILSEIRRLIASNKPGEGLAGFRAEDNGRHHLCLEPHCSCGYGTCGPFRDPPTRCVTFELVLLPAFPDLERAYWAHLRGETGIFTVERCRDVKCRRRCAPGSAYCPWHTDTHERAARRAVRALREKRARDGQRKYRAAILDGLAVAGE